MNELFYYDETSPTCLRWKVDRRSGNGGRCLSAMAGDVAGSLDIRGEAFVTKFNGKNVKVHNVVASLHGLLLTEGFVIDHEDGNPQNNKIGNLRIVTGLLNAHNRKKQHNNTSGTTGVTEWEDQRGSVFWMARWQVKTGKRGAKLFSVRKYGATEAYEMAVKHREAMILKLTEEGHGYTERHGK